MVLHLIGSKVTFHSSAHSFIVLRSLFKLAATVLISSDVLIGAKSIEPSAYRNRSFAQTSTRSLMKTENKSEPSIDSWGTEALMDTLSDAWPDMITLMDLSHM